MRTTLELLNEVLTLGFNKDEALESIDMALDDEFGYKNRKPIEKEQLNDELYETILDSFKCELD